MRGNAARLRRLERAVALMEADAKVSGSRLLSDIEIAEGILVAEIAAGACLYCAHSGPWGSRASFTHPPPPPETAQEAAEGLVHRLEALQKLTGERGDAWAARVERLLSGDEFTRNVAEERRHAVQKRVEAVRAAVRGMVEFSR